MCSGWFYFFFHFPARNVLGCSGFHRLPFRLARNVSLIFPSVVTLFCRGRFIFLFFVFFWLFFWKFWFLLISFLFMVSLIWYCLRLFWLLPIQFSWFFCQKLPWSTLNVQSDFKLSSHVKIQLSHSVQFKRPFLQTK